MEWITLDGERSHLGIGDLDALGVAVRIELAAHRQAGLRGGRADQLDDDLMADRKRGFRTLPAGA